MPSPPEPGAASAPAPPSPGEPQSGEPTPQTDSVAEKATAETPDAEAMRQRRLLVREGGVFALAATALLIAWLKIPDPGPTPPRVELAAAAQDRMLVDMLVLRYLESPSVRQSGRPSFEGLSAFLARFAGPAALPAGLVQDAAREAMGGIRDMGTEAFRQWLQARLGGAGGGEDGGADTAHDAEPGGASRSCTTNVYLCDRPGGNCARRECARPECPPAGGPAA